ncbi:hypothetical protein [Brevibacillus laterosporus]|uniref:Uncharacterized protein n=1 Tax=Brevibacillus laterosporus TaxID=1465 RepID=A0A0F7EID6_BRELA|nr:hypothetical protein [Brevibacillus laterosporus]AKF95535.1 hypothetical protein EX87_18155 [Brevibacillus laterosporus]
MASKILDPLVTKFILPEHIEMLCQLHEDKKRIAEVDFCYRISDHVSMTMALTISRWKEKKEGRGEIGCLGVVDKFDSTFK